MPDLSRPTGHRSRRRTWPRHPLDCFLVVSYLPEVPGAPHVGLAQAGSVPSALSLAEDFSVPSAIRGCSNPAAQLQTRKFKVHLVLLGKLPPPSALKTRGPPQGGPSCWPGTVLPAPSPFND
jgi:hypothetical protein